jgi:hypothetical protein
MNLSLPLLLLTGLLLCGCSTFHSQQIERAPDGTTRTTDVTASTFFDSRSDLSKLRASTTDKSQTTSIGGLDQSSSSTNINTLLDTVISSAVQAGAKAVKP